MSTQSSITWGFGAMLVLLLVSIGGYAYHTVGQLEQSTRAIPQDSFYQVQLGQQMLRALGQASAAPNAPGLAPFAGQLHHEAGNITESRIFYATLRKQNRHWFLNINLPGEPFGMRYVLTALVPDMACKINFQLGFRIQPRISLLFRRVLQGMAAKSEIDSTSRYATLPKRHLPGGFRFVVPDRGLSFGQQLSCKENLTLKVCFLLNRPASSDRQDFGLDTSGVAVELVPLTIQPCRQLDLPRTPPAAQPDPVLAALVADEDLVHKG